MELLDEFVHGFVVAVVVALVEVIESATVASAVMEILKGSAESFPLWIVTNFSENSDPIPHYTKIRKK